MSYLPHDDQGFSGGNHNFGEEFLGPGNAFAERKAKEIDLIKAAYASAASHTNPAVSFPNFRYYQYTQVHPAVMALAFASTGSPVAEMATLNALSRITELYIRRVSQIQIY